MKVMLVESNSPFRVTLSAKNSGEIKMSGLAESIPSD